MRKGRALLRVANRVLPEHEARLVTKSFDVVGDIAVLRIPPALEAKRFELAEGLLEELPCLKVVLGQVGPTSGERRIRDLEWLAGEKRTDTVHREHGCLFHVDLAKTYFSPRLAFERERVAKLVGPSETLVNMFAGVGCYSIVAAKRNPSCTVYSIDVSPDAMRFLKLNIAANGVGGRVIPLEGDARRVIEERLRGVASRILMPLPERASEFLDAALAGLGGGGWIHYYAFVHARGEDPLEKARVGVLDRLRSLGARATAPLARVVRTVGPNWYQVAVDLSVTKAT